jgi:uncharacterized membrane protein YjfL (UPF0719 family)
MALLLTIPRRAHRAYAVKTTNRVDALVRAGVLHLIFAFVNILYTKLQNKITNGNQNKAYIEMVATNA